MRQLPEGSRMIEVDEFLQCIGELYFQNRMLRETIQKLQPPAAPPNGVEHAVPEQFRAAE